MLIIKDILKEKGVRVSDLANKVGITQPNMSNILNGKTTPSLATLQKIATAFEVDILDLFEDNRPEKPAAGCVCPKCGTALKIDLQVKDI